MQLLKMAYQMISWSYIWDSSVCYYCDINYGGVGDIWCEN